MITDGAIDQAVDFALDIKRLYSFFIGDIKSILDVQNSRMTAEFRNRLDTDLPNQPTTAGDDNLPSFQLEQVKRIDACFLDPGRE